MRHKSRKVIVVTDPGPDPDDVKALLALAVAHKRGEVQLVACVANGGGFPARRAQLARLILDRMGEPNIPVGIGSVGTAVLEQPHECSLHGFDSVDVKRLIDGPTLLSRTLARSPAGSVTMLLISSLRDFADVILASPELVLRAVSFVAVQGGLVADPNAPYGFRGDTSQNNAFHPASAEIVYNFCFEHRIRMSVVSRNAVPLLPMQLARSFAVRTQSALLTYLAKAQFLGLEGLWQKLCAGQLPNRCDKVWYFQTFCGVSPEQFEKRKLGLLTASASVLPHLNGYVKPYDVLALMTALPTTAGWFSPDAEVVVNGASHLLLLEPEHTIDVRSVHNFLRETYHAVALVDSDPEEWRSWRHPRVHRRSRRAPVKPAADAELGDPLPLMVRNPSLARLSSTSQSMAVAPDVAGHGGTRQEGGRAEAARAQQPWSSHRARQRPGGTTAVVSFAREPFTPIELWRWALQMRRGLWPAPASPMSRSDTITRLHAERLRAPEGTVSAALTTELMAESVAAARVRHSRLTLAIAVLTAFICTGALAVWLTTLPGFPRSEADILRLRTSVGVSYFTRVLLAANGLGATGCMMLLCLFPSYEHLTRMLLVAAFGYGINLGASLPYMVEFVGLMKRGWDAEGHGPGGKDAVQFFSAVGSGSQAIGSILVCGVSIPLVIRRRKDPRCVLDILWNSLVATYLLNAAINLVIWFGLFLGGIALPQPAAAGGPCTREHAISVVATVLALTHTLSYVMWAYVARTHAIVRRMRACLAVFSGASGLLESLAPLLGYGQLEGERDVAELHREAKAAFCGAVLDAAGLAALGHAWGVGKGGRSAAAAHDGAGQDGEAQQLGDAAAVRLAEVGVQASAVPSAPTSFTAVRRVDAVDAYIVHSWREEHVDAKLEVLTTWCRTFTLSRGRPPVVWVDALCALPPTASAKPAKRSSTLRSLWPARRALVSPSAESTSRESAAPSEPPQAATFSAAVHAMTSAAHTNVPPQSVECQLEHLPVRLACSAQLLVLASPSLFDRLWPVIEIHTWKLTGGGQELIRVLPVAPTQHEASALLAAVDTFHVVYCHAELPADRRRISMAVEIATMPVVNEAVRALFAPVRDALRRQAVSQSTTTGDSKRVSTVSATATEAVDEMGDWYDEPVAPLST